MARSIHTTKKDLKRERYFSASDGVPFGPDATELEAQHIKKLLFKDNEGWKRAAEKKKMPAVGRFKLKEGKIVFKLLKTNYPIERHPPSESP